MPWAILTAGHASVVVRLEVKLVTIGVAYHELNIPYEIIGSIIESDGTPHMGPGGTRNKRSIFQVGGDPFFRQPFWGMWE